MKPEYELKPDERQWVLWRTALTDKGTIREHTIGYYPKLHQGLQAMYEAMCRDAIPSIPGDLESIKAAVAEAKNIYGGIK
jgi:hypothetical protein